MRANRGEVEQIGPPVTAVDVMTRPPAGGAEQSSKRLTSRSFFAAGVSSRIEFPARCPSASISRSAATCQALRDLAVMMPVGRLRKRKRQAPGGEAQADRALQRVARQNRWSARGQRHAASGQRHAASGMTDRQPWADRCDQPQHHEGFPQCRASIPWCERSNSGLRPPSREEPAGPSMVGTYGPAGAAGQSCSPSRGGGGGSCLP